MQLSIISTSPYNCALSFFSRSAPVCDDIELYKQVVFLKNYCNSKRLLRKLNFLSLGVSRVVQKLVSPFYILYLQPVVLYMQVLFDIHKVDSEQMDYGK